MCCGDRFRKWITCLIHLNSVSDLQLTLIQFHRFLLVGIVRGGEVENTLHHVHDERADRGLTEPRSQQSHHRAQRVERFRTTCRTPASAHRVAGSLILRL